MPAKKLRLAVTRWPISSLPSLSRGVCRLPVTGFSSPLWLIGSIGIKTSDAFVFKQVFRRVIAFLPWFLGLFQTEFQRLFPFLVHRDNLERAFFGDGHQVSAIIFIRRVGNFTREDIGLEMVEIGILSFQHDLAGGEAPVCLDIEVHLVVHAAL